MLQSVSWRQRRLERPSGTPTFATRWSMKRTTLDHENDFRWDHFRHMIGLDGFGGSTTARRSGDLRSGRVSANPLLLDISSTDLALRRGPVVLKTRELVSPITKPFVKWPGGKQWLAFAAPHLVPSNWEGRYYEPFVGGAALFFALRPTRATLSDRNSQLVATYRAIRTQSDKVIRLLSQYPYEKGFYYDMRDAAPRADTTIAARLLYLNRTCWNGLYRVNKDGRFNTPFGTYINPTICDSTRIKAAARVLWRTTLREGDFAEVVAEAKAGDLVYFDPPYITGHQQNGFLKYNAPLFSWEDQRRLARVAKELSGKGVYVLISNADHTSVRRLYGGFHCYRVRRNSLIAGPVESRGFVSEIIVSSYPILGRASKVD